MIEILIADDNAILAQQLSNSLTREKDFKVLKISKNGKEAINDYLSLKPDVLILDLDMPIMNGLEVIDYLTNLQSVSDRKDIIVLSGSDFFRSELSNPQKVKYILKRNTDNSLLFELIREIKDEQRYKPTFKSDLEELFTNLNLKSYNKGTKYLKYAIEIVYYDNTDDINISNVTHKIALHNNIPHNNTIQSNIDKAVDSIFSKHSNSEILENVFFTSSKISTKEFITRVINYIDCN